MSDCWDDMAVGIKVEVVNSDCDNFSEDFPDYYWVASIVQIAGRYNFFKITLLILSVSRY